MSFKGVGMLIAFAGMPSAGKSSTARRLASRMGAHLFVEPEEESWPDLVKERATVGSFTALTWFRSARVPGLFHAHAVREAGGLAIVDSYYDVLVSKYLGEEPFEWLLSASDPYFAAANAMADADWALLPKADVLVMLRLDEAVWKTFMGRRGRDFDLSAELSSHFEMQALLEQACQLASREHGTRLIIVDQRDSSPDDTAARIQEMIQE